jgi:hypothetical protein
VPGQNKLVLYIFLSNLKGEKNVGKANVILVKEFLNLNTNRPVPLTEMNEFWKSCSMEEREQYAAEVRKLVPELDGATTAAVPA